MTKVEVSVIINRPAVEVFGFISNFENNPRWQSGVQEATITSEGPFGVGTTYTQVAKFLGQRIETDFEVIEYEPDRKVKARSTSGSFPIQFMRMVEPIEAGTKVSAVIEGEAGGFFKLAEPILSRMTRRQIEADYANLRDLLEAED
jgi:uncharacterized membrane protein